MNMKLLSVAICYMILSMSAYSQSFDFKTLEFNNIKNAPKFEQPKFLLNANGDPIRVDKLGHAAPLFFDWDGDGKKDLLVGEFGSGKNSNLMVFKNIDKKRKPKFASEGFYAKDVKGEKLFIFGS